MAYAQGQCGYASAIDGITWGPLRGWIGFQGKKKSCMAFLHRDKKVERPILRPIFEDFFLNTRIICPCNNSTLSFK